MLVFLRGVTRKPVRWRYGSCALRSSRTVSELEKPSALGAREMHNRSEGGKDRVLPAAVTARAVTWVFDRRGAGIIVSRSRQARACDQTPGRRWRRHCEAGAQGRKLREFPLRRGCG